MQNSEDALLALIGQTEFNLRVGAVSLPDTPYAKPSFDASYRLARENQPDLMSAQTSKPSHV